MTRCRSWHSAQDLPAEWDQLANSRFQSREFLAHCEEWNSCSQRYYGAFEANQLIACAVVYSLGLDLLTFTRARMALPTQIIGIPCSVSSPGLFGAPDGAGWLVQELNCLERGLLLALNLAEGTPIPPAMIQGHTLPTIRVERNLTSWVAYLDSLRSHYRRRMKRIEGRSPDLEVELEECSTYTHLHHALYLQVFHQSASKLERLTPGFFENLQRPFRLLTMRRHSQLQGWALILDDPGEFTFVLGGVEYGNNAKDATYLRLLLEVLRRGIESGARRIEFGQTAEVPKLRLGGELHPLCMAATHSNPLFRTVLRGFSRFLEYRRSVPEHKVFRGAS